MANNRIKTAREAAHLSQGDLAEKLGVTRQTISAYERGQREPRLGTWKSLSDNLFVSIPYLQGISNDPVGIEETITNTMTNRELKGILNDFEKGNKTPEETEKVLDAIKKVMNNRTALNQMHMRAMSQLASSIENIDFEKMDTFEMMNINDAIQLCRAFYDKFHSNRELFSSFSALLSSLRSIVADDGQVDYVKSEFMSSFEQLLDAVMAKRT